MKKAIFGKVDDYSQKTATYSSTSWHELSRSVKIAMYTTAPGTMEALEYPSITLTLGEIGVQEDICPCCNLPMDQHEICNEFIQRIERLEKTKSIKIKDIHSRLVNP